MIPRWIRPLFVVAALYDLVLGLAFLMLYGPIYTHYHVALPNHPGYVQLNALFVIVMGIGFALIALAPQRNRDLITVGALFKAAYAGVVFWYVACGRMPAMWIPWAVCDTLFLVAFLAARAALPKEPSARVATT